MESKTTQEKTGIIQLRGDFVLLRADRLRLILPQHDLGESEYLEQQPQEPSPDGLFAIGERDEFRLHLAALSERLQLLPEYPADRFVLTQLRGQDELRFAWSEVRVMMNTQIELHPLPAVLQSGSFLIEAYTSLASGEVAFFTTAARLLSELENHALLADAQDSRSSATAPVLP